jgi:hypothetical protein
MIDAGSTILEILRKMKTIVGGQHSHEKHTGFAR